MPSRAAVYSPSTFDDHNDSARPTVAVVSQGFADRHWRDRSPLGQYVRFMVRGASVRAESVGVVDDLVGAITHPLRSRIRRGALQPSLSELRCSSFQ